MITILTKFQAKYYAYELTKKHSSDTIEKLIPILQDAQVDLNPHQVEAALFAFKSPLSKGAILADEVGLGKTIEAGIVLSQNWAERRRRILIITPSSLRKQWSLELMDKFFLPTEILESKSFNDKIKLGSKNPFVDDNIIITSYNFTKSKAEYIKAVSWDLVVIDEAHRLRNVYRNDNKIAKAIKDATEHCKKLLLTATPLQNSLLELYGLVSFIDEHTFGDLLSFKSQFSRIEDNEQELFNDLKSRLSPICCRTLRRQVLEYINYTNRISITQEFIPTENEHRLYEMVSQYLTRYNLYALPVSQRQLITLILRKLLASSSFAIEGTLASLIERLEAMLKNAKLVKNPKRPFLCEALEDIYTTEEIDELIYEEYDENIELAYKDYDNIYEEINELKSFKALAGSIAHNAKADALLTALDKGFYKLKELGAAQKAVIFTESRRTQDYLYRWLSQNGYEGKLVLFNGTNNDEQSKKIYINWYGIHKDSDRVTGSKTADMRQALVDHFKEHSQILIATEAAAEGINLQFCSLVVNYDLPWNPMRIEQRIGRCHRYGQKFDVVVINFLNKKNEADQRIYELLTFKFKLFDGVFGASDEVLGIIESGVDFEKRIANIYQSCRKEEDIKTAFDLLQTELEQQISEKMESTRKKLLENFDQEVHEKLRVNLKNSREYITQYEEKLWRITQFFLDSHADFNAVVFTFNLKTNPFPLLKIPLGEYRLAKKCEDAHIYRTNHPLAQGIIKMCKELVLSDSEIVFNYTNHHAKISALEPLCGKSGELAVYNITVESIETENHIIIAATDESGKVQDGAVMSRIFNLNAVIENEGIGLLNTDTLFAIAEDNKLIILDEISRKNAVFYGQEADKLDKWAEDIKKSIEIELRQMDTQIKTIKTDSRKIPKLEDKLEMLKEVKELERKRNKLRHELFEEQDKIDEQRDKLVSNIENRLKQKVSTERLFGIRWRVQ